jgi:cobalt-zinc-cadmium resistance protein CzcA
LVSALRQGGLVIYFRHADTGPAYQEQGVDLKRCDSQRNLNDKGRNEARQIGAQFKRLGIPVGEVIEPGRRFPLVVRLPMSYRDDPKSLEEILIPTASGQRLPITELATIAPANPPSR